MGSWIRRLRAIPELLVAYAVLETDARATWIDPEVQAAVERFKRDPAIAPLVPRFSMEWRALQEAIHRLQ